MLKEKKESPMPLPVRVLEKMTGTRLKRMATILGGVALTGAGALLVAFGPELVSKFYGAKLAAVGAELVVGSGFVIGIGGLTSALLAGVIDLFAYDDFP